MERYMVAKINEIAIAKRRGFDVSEISSYFNEEMTLDTFRILTQYDHKNPEGYKDNLNTRYVKPGSNESLLVFYLQTGDNASVSQNIIKSFIEYFNDILLKNPDVDTTAILISPVELTHASRKPLQSKIGEKITFFLIDELGYDPFDHIFTPNQFIMSEKDASEYLQAFNIQNKFTLPLMRIDDPIARRLNAKRGDLIFCERYRQRAFIKVQPFIRVVN